MAGLRPQLKLVRLRPAGQPKTQFAFINRPRPSDWSIPMTLTKLIIAALMVPVLTLIAIGAAVVAIVHWL
jgi:hypothetical protein